MEQYLDYRVYLLPWSKRGDKDMTGYKSTGSMRLASKQPFQVRKNSGIREPRRIFIIFTEGVETEQRYFEELSKSEKVKKNIQIKVLNRWKEHSGRSNQFQVVDDIREFIFQATKIDDKDKSNFESYFKQIVDGCNIQTLLNITNKIPKLIQKYPNLISEEENIQNQLFALATITTYDSNYDKICIIIDRDMNSFSKEQYQDTVKLSEDNNFILGITNPCFEFFLLMHIYDISDISNDDILENKKEQEKTLMERILDKCLKEGIGTSFKKRNYDVKYFIENIDKGIENSKLYQFENHKLINEVGTSVFTILDEILESQS